jgi:hypothetical protein
MSWTRREFLFACMAGAVTSPLARTGFAAKLLPPSDPTAGPADAALLDELQRASFDFFWNEADPHSGLVKDRANANGGDSRLLSSIAATGFGLTALCIGHRRRYRSHAEVTARVRQTLKFLAHQAPQEHGFFYHYVDRRDGKRVGATELSPIDMALLLCGVLTCRTYFHDREIQRDATLIYNRVDWPWATNGGDTLALEWKPERGFSVLRWNCYCECMMLYLLALGSPTYPLPARSWHSFQRPWVEYGKYRFISTHAPLFIHQFSHAWFDFRGKQDDYADYFTNSTQAIQAHRQFCLELTARFPSYSETAWGITASDSSKGYVAWGGPPAQGPIDGTIVPAAAAGSLPFLFPESMAVLQNLRREFGDRIWKRYGFVDAFNPLTGWVGPDVVGIDVGISMLMAENARTQFVWNTFMRNPEVLVAMDKAGFREEDRSQKSEARS